MLAALGQLRLLSRRSHVYCAVLPFHWVAHDMISQVEGPQFRPRPIGFAPLHGSVGEWQAGDPAGTPTQVVTLVELDAITDAGINLWPALGLPHLRYVGLHGFTGITDEVAASLHGIDGLRTVDLRNCTRVPLPYIPAAGNDTRKEPRHRRASEADIMLHTAEKAMLIRWALPIPHGTMLCESAGQLPVFHR